MGVRNFSRLTQGQCSQQGGQWAPPGSTWTVDSNGIVQITQQSTFCRYGAWAGGYLTFAGLGVKAASAGGAVLSIATGGEVLLLESNPIGWGLTAGGIGLWAAQRFLC